MVSVVLEIREGDQICFGTIRNCDPLKVRKFKHRFFKAMREGNLSIRYRGWTRFDLAQTVDLTDLFEAEENYSMVS